MLSSPLVKLIAVGELHVGDAAVGFVDTTALDVPAKPPFATATHRDVDGHEIVSGPTLLLSMVVGALHVGVAAVGLVEITARSEKSTATHNTVDAHDTPVKPKAPEPVSSGPDEVHVGVAAVGFVDTKAWVWSTATHSAVEAHDTATNLLVPSMSEGALHVGVAAVGLLEMTTLPPASTAMQSAVDGQETLVSVIGVS